MKYITLKGHNCLLFISRSWDFDFKKSIKYHITHEVSQKPSVLRFSEDILNIYFNYCQSSLLDLSCLVD